MPMWLARLLSICLSHLEGPLTPQEVYRLHPADWAIGKVDASARASADPLLGMALPDQAPADAPLAVVEA